jgi:hypothetical protein
MGQADCRQSKGSGASEAGSTGQQFAASHWVLATFQLEFTAHIRANSASSSFFRTGVGVSPSRGALWWSQAKDLGRDCERGGKTVQQGDVG